MKTTGVVRRIDDLGRIVIPKEIRKSLRIKDGESLEIFLDSGNIILKRYSEVDSFKTFCEMYVESICNSTFNNVLIVDRNVVIAGAGGLKRDYIDFNISSFLDGVIRDRMNLVSFDRAKVGVVDSRIDFISYIICPIIVNGDAIGAVIIFSGDSELDVIDERICVSSAKFLSKYVELWCLLCYNFVCKCVDEKLEQFFNYREFVVGESKY